MGSPKGDIPKSHDQLSQSRPLFTRINCLSWLFTLDKQFIQIFYPKVRISTNLLNNLVPVSQWKPLSQIINNKSAYQRRGHAVFSSRDKCVICLSLILRVVRLGSCWHRKNTQHLAVITIQTIMGCIVELASKDLHSIFTWKFAWRLGILCEWSLALGRGGVLCLHEQRR